MSGPQFPRPNLDEISGIPVAWADAPGVYTGSLLFRVGKSDETLPTTGITHLVEHLSVFPVGRKSYEYGAFVDGTRTVFWAVERGPRWPNTSKKRRAICASCPSTGSKTSGVS